MFHAARIHVNPLVGQCAHKTTMARLGLGVGGRPSNHRDLAAVVGHHQVLDCSVHPNLVVHEQRGHARDLDAQAHAGQGSKALHECGYLVCGDVVADGVRANEQGVHVVRAHDVEHEALGMLRLNA